MGITHTYTRIQKSVEDGDDGGLGGRVEGAAGRHSSCTRRDAEDCHHAVLVNSSQLINRVFLHQS